MSLLEALLEMKYLTPFRRTCVHDDTMPVAVETSRALGMLNVGNVLNCSSAKGRLFRLSDILRQTGESKYRSVPFGVIGFWYHRGR